ncbi:MAG: hypothetical protein ACLUIO_19490 [Neglectibacter timonensis]
MANSKPYADAFSSAFEEENAFLDFLRERDDRGEWTKRHTRDLRILPLGTENAPDAEPLPGYTQDDLREILADTMENTRLLLKSKELLYPSGTAPLRPRLERAKISVLPEPAGKPVWPASSTTAWHANGEALLRISDGKLSAVSWRGQPDYAVLEMPELFGRVCPYFTRPLRRLSFAGGLRPQHGHRHLGDNR